jgi:multimeric flavodoxin WrbA/putative sterol carrier protein
MQLSRGEIDKARGLMDGLYTVEGDMGLLTRMVTLFRPPKAGEQVPGPAQRPESDEDQAKKEGHKMRILAVQGSPRPKATSNTEVLLQQFLKGAESEGAETETVYLREKQIHPCIGCFTCWLKTPGICAFKDDMPDLLEKVKEADILVFATPLYDFNMTASMKAFQERLLPCADPHMIKDGEIYRHPGRDDRERKMVLVSNCGFPEVSHFDGLRRIFRQFGDSGKTDLVGEILMPAGELLQQEVFKPKVQPVMDAVYRAGVEVVRDGRVSKGTETVIQTPILPADQMAAMANAYFDSCLTPGRHRQTPTPGKIGDMRFLLHGMAANFNAREAGDLKAIIQFHVTGAQPGEWFLSIGEGKCGLLEGVADAPTLTITTPSDVWLAIANKELDGQTAFMEGKYTVKGDISLLMRMKSLFGG